MFFSQHIIHTQAVLVVLETTFGCNSENLFVDLPLAEMLNINPVDMVKFTLNLEASLGFELKLEGINNQSSINEIAKMVEKSRKSQCLKAA